MIWRSFNDIITAMLVEFTQFETKLSLFTCMTKIDLLIKDKV